MRIWIVKTIQSNPRVILWFNFIFTLYVYKKIWFFFNKKLKYLILIYFLPLSKNFIFRYIKRLDQMPKMFTFQ